MFDVYLTAVSGMTRQQIIEEAKQFDNNLKSETMSIIDEFVQEGIEIGTEREKKETKIKIYNAWKRGYKPELLSNVFDLTLQQVKDIIVEIKTEMEKKTQ